MGDLPGALYSKHQNFANKKLRPQIWYLSCYMLLSKSLIGLHLGQIELDLQHLVLQLSVLDCKEH